MSNSLPCGFDRTAAREKAVVPGVESCKDAKLLHGAVTLMARSQTFALAVSALMSLGFGCGVAAAAPPDEPVPLATPVPIPTTSGSPLRLIGRVHAKTTFCQAVLDHGGLATASVLEGDDDIDDDVNYLSKVDLDSSELARHRAVTDLTARFTALQTRSKAAIRETKALRDRAAAAPTQEQKAALIAYANALGGALRRQLEFANALTGFTVSSEAHQTVTQQENDLDYSRTVYSRLGPWEHSADPRDRNPGTMTQMARSAASALVKLRGPERDDEVLASQQADAGFSPCLK